MKVRITTGFLLSLLTFCSYSQPVFYSVIAHNGLTLRDEPSASAKVITTLPFRAQVSSWERPEGALEVSDNGKVVKGNWVKVRYEKLDVTGYVFDGYLLPGADPEYESWCDKNNKPCPCLLYGYGFTATLYDYEASAEPAKGDTIFSYEDIGVEIEKKILEIRPELKTDSVVVYYTLVESLYPFGVSKPKEMSWEDFQSRNPSWRGHREFKRLKGKGNFFRIPSPNYAMMEGWRKCNLNLEDTLLGQSGEGGYIEATVSRNGVPYVYQMSDALIKVVLYRNGIKHKTTFIKANFTYGC